MDLSNLQLDLITGINVTSYVIFGLAFLLFSGGINLIRTARKSRYFRRRRAQISNGWRRIFFSILVTVFGFLLLQFGAPVATTFITFTPTPSVAPTIGNTPTYTPVPSHTPTPTITETPSESHTPTVTPTPHLPVAIEAQFTSQVTPGENIIFSELTFSKDLSEAFEPIEPGTTFSNPVTEIYALFSYDGLTLGSQWTALWYRDGDLVHYESFPWTDSTGGYGYTNWAPDDPADWQPGNYQVQIFVGSTWFVVGNFSIEGIPPTAEPSTTQTPTITETLAETYTRTPWPTLTRTLTSTAWPTPEPKTATPSKTPWPTLTRTITPTLWPTLTRTPTWVTPLNNIALYKPATASNALYDNPPNFAVDNKTNTKWDSGSGPTQWIEIDLLGEFDISEFRLIAVQWPIGESHHTIQVMYAGTSTFADVHNFIGMTKDDDLLIYVPDEPLENITHVRIETSATTAWVAWKEIIINGEESNP